MDYRLLAGFRSLFEGRKYLHRNSSQGDRVAFEFYEDLFSVGRSKRYVTNIEEGTSVLNTKNLRQGVKARRGDGTFGESLPGVEPLVDTGFNVPRGNIATVEIGIEVKILAKAMIKQIGRVVNDLKSQAEAFKAAGGDPICVGIVGINQAAHYTGYEGDRSWPTDGTKHKHPAQEAEEAEKRLISEAKPYFDELLILRFSATNEGSLLFHWTDEGTTSDDYGAILVRVSREYNNRF